MLAAAESERDRLLLLLDLYTGLRVSELCALRVEHIDLEGLTLEVHEGKGRKDRNLPLHPALVPPLQAWIGERQTGYLFPSPKLGDTRHLSPRTVQLMVSAAAAKAGIVRRITPHKLRHTFATDVLERGAAIHELQALLGHSRLDTTGIYLHSNPDRLRNAIGRL